MGMGNKKSIKKFNSGIYSNTYTNDKIFDSYLQIPYLNKKNSQSSQSGTSSNNTNNNNNINVYSELTDKSLTSANMININN